MKTRTLTRIGAPALLLALTAIGCTPDERPTSASAAPAKAERQAARRAAAAQAALKKRDAGTAVAEAEAAVALAPNDAGYRAALGQAYLLAGRFASAEASFADAVALDPTPGRAQFNLALSRIALGRVDEARGSLAQLEGVVPDTDIGLATALAGDRQAAIAILERAARVEGAGATARQNLALAYALDGRWTEAQAVAAQDLAGAQILVRIGEWARFAHPQAASDQVASLLGVVAVADPGQPVALALRTEASQMLAAAPPAAAIAQPETQPETMWAQAEAVPADSGVVRVASVAEIAPDRPAVAQPVAQREPSSAPTLRSGGNWVIQLGAYSQPRAMATAWSRIAGRVTALRGYAPAGSTLTGSGTGTLHRLAMTGFSSRGDAQRVCTQIKARGGACFVRASAGDQPLQWASRRDDLFASR